MFHSVVPEGQASDWKWSISQRNFFAILDLLQEQGWKTVCVRDLLKGMADSRTVVLTFDDGYADNGLAFEELQKRGMRATWFVVSRYLGREADWDDSRTLSRPLLSVSDLKEMAGAGMEIGSHSCTHPRLTSLEPDRAYREVADSKVELEQMLSREVVSFAYPYGEFNKRVRDLVNDAGYSAACTSRTGWALRDNDPLQIRRLTVYSADSVSSLARKLAFADNNVGWATMFRYTARRLGSRVGL